jgi:hypothetical protein
LLSAPLALIVAFLAHTAEFGSSHAFGGVYGVDLIAAALAALTLTAIVTPIVVAFSAPRISGRSLASFAARLGLDLSVCGIGVYAGMECLEGHVPVFSAGSVALLLGSAVVVALATLFATDCG